MSRRKNDLNLTKRQCDVLQAFADLGDSKRVGAAMDMAPRTVDEHLRRIVKNLGVRNKVQAVVRWERSTTTGGP